MARLALTGATGFVGRAVLNSALIAGHEVRALTRRPQARTHEKLTWVSGALGEADAELVEGCDAVIHIAGLIKARRRADYFEVNADAVAALREAAGERRFVLLSSLAAREPGLSDYAASKRAGEAALSDHPDALIIRAPAVFGPGDTATRPLFRLMDRGILPVAGGTAWRKQRIAYVFIRDLAGYIVEQTTTDLTGTVTPSTAPGLRWSEFAELSSRAIGREIRLLPLPPALLKPVAAATSVTSRLAGVGHLTLGKLREFRHDDWSVSESIPGATPMVEALRTTFESYR